MKITKLFNKSICMMLIVVSTCCMIVVIFSMFYLPDVPTAYYNDSSQIKGTISKYEKLGTFGEMMIEMLPNDLAFTVFVPSEKAFERDLKLRVNHSYSPKEWDNVYATVSLVLGFSTIPRKIYADSIPFGKYLSYDSISGFILSISKDFDGVLVVNRIKAKQGYIKRGEVVVYVMDGVIMDAEFEQSVGPNDEEEDDALNMNDALHMKV